MRVAAFLFSLGLFASAVVAAPAPAPNGPILFAKDPLSVHKRAPEPAVVPAASVSAHTSPADTIVEIAEPDEEACVAICGIKRVEGAKSEREALCSVDGLKATLDCAQCIDTTWPDTTWEDSAMAEYHRIVDACDDTPIQKVMRPVS